MFPFPLAELKRRRRFAGARGCAWRVLLSVACAALLAMPAARATETRNHGAATPAAQEVELGNSTVDLTGPWKFHTGDDMAWAQPGFDDRSWGTMDLAPPPGSIDPILGTGGFVPGWTQRGYPGYAGYAWYRLTVNVHNRAWDSGKEPLAIKMPDDFDDAYQVYVNGRLVGEYGRFTSKGVTANRRNRGPLPYPRMCVTGR